MTDSVQYPLLFIGMPVYNGERFISIALDSLISQTFQDWTLLISDNGSTDRTEEIAKTYSEIDKRIHYHRHAENKGAVKNFTFVVSQAQARSLCGQQRMMYGSPAF